MSNLGTEEYVRHSRARSCMFAPSTQQLNYVTETSTCHRHIERTILRPAVDNSPW